MTLAAGLLVFVCGGTVSADEVAPVPQSAEEVLELSAKAYRELPALTDTLTLRTELPGAEPGLRVIRYAVGPGKVGVEIEQLIGFVATDDQVHLYRVGVDDRYLEARLEEGPGGLAKSLAALSGNSPMAGLLEPPQVAFRVGGDRDRILSALRITSFLEPLAVDAYERLADGRHEIRFTAANGVCRVRWDPHSLLLESMDATFHPEGAPEGFMVRLEGSFSPEPCERYRPVSSFDPAGRTAVARIDDLGPPAPEASGDPASVLPPELLEEQLLGPDELAARIADNRVLLFGETHLVNEPMAYTTALLERLGERRLSLLLELPAQTQPLLDRYLENGDEEALRALFSQPFVLQYQDLVQWAGKNRKRIRKVLAIDEDNFRIRLQRLLSADSRNQTMAEAIAKEYREHPDTLVVAYCGQLHLLRGGRYRYDHPSRVPAGARLAELGVPPAAVTNIMLDGGERFPLHEVWKEAGALPITGDLARIPFPYFIEYPIFGVTQAGELFDFWVNLGPLTPVEKWNSR